MVLILYTSLLRTITSKNQNVIRRMLAKELEVLNLIKFTKFMHSVGISPSSKLDAVA